MDSVSPSPSVPAPAAPAPADDAVRADPGHGSTPADAPARRHPRAVVPDTLFTDPADEQRWRARFSAVRLGLPTPARDAENRTVFVTNASGRYELTCWAVDTDVRTQATDRPDGTTHGALTPDGGQLWWFDDDAGNEFGSWQVQPFGSGPGSAQPAPALQGVAPGYPAGLELGDRVVLAGFSDDDGTRVHRAVPGSADSAELVYEHETDGGVGALSADETLWVLAHSEHGDSRYPALRVFTTDGNDVVAELDDGPGKGLNPVAFSPVPGDQRLLVGHERRGRDELLVWDPTTGAVQELVVDLPGDLDGDFEPDGGAVLVLRTHAGRTTLHRFQPATGELDHLPAAKGEVAGAVTRRDGSVWYRWSSAASPAQVRVLHADGSDATLLTADGPAAPDSEPVTDVWVDGPGGSIHALLGMPAGPMPDGGWPTVFFLHGGPAAADEDSYDATRAVWLDAGLAVVQVNYRGSTGYGSTWRDALTERIGHTELADVAAVHDRLIADGVVDPARSVVAGYSWGGFLTLLAVGSQPDRWAAGVAGVPVADYIAAYEDEMEPLRAYDRALFGGSPQERPEAYRDSSPLTWVQDVRVPVLILAGENDPRCPIRQIDNYLDALADRAAHEPAAPRYAEYRYEAGHGSMVVQERIRQVACEVDFVRAALALTPATPSTG
ncbi:S9 family peptidase [Nakamurella flavida]|uniref:S9 family peptidase n=1 Tax=Nakamurella flavida TaxID=363630 RepID=A0A939C5K3_9ACTN|nr:prolyl oligopeptidase family serine peptidase [Nakamurella flavida]MBM9476282.1 S9 family peptidase [Nakamurella flavida]MDP9779618.1 dipeptidyl aminopeptidase/acylaminoacyl peptidase [Nakamurella flavida]